MIFNKCCIIKPNVTAFYTLTVDEKGGISAFSWEKTIKNVNIYLIQHFRSSIYIPDRIFPRYVIIRKYLCHKSLLAQEGEWISILPWKTRNGSQCTQTRQMYRVFLPEASPKRDKWKTLEDKYFQSVEHFVQCLRSENIIFKNCH